MATRYTEEDLAVIQKRLMRGNHADLSKFETNSGRDIPLVPKTKPKASKFGNVITVVDGIKFASKLEAERYRQLCVLRKAEKVRFFIRQPQFDLPGGIIVKADFLVVWVDHRVVIEDAKGFQTQASKNNYKQVKALYGIDVVLVTKRKR